MTPALRNEPMLIAGGGIGGLSAAIALAGQETSVRILEREPSFSAEGAGIQLGPNATRLLRAWGVLERLSSTSVRAEGIGIGDGMTGEPVATVPLGEMAEERYGAPYLLVHRADLQKALLDTVRDLANVEILTGHEVTGFEQFPDEIVVETSARSLRGRALIAADGLWSTLRNEIDGSGFLAMTDNTAWRTLVDPAVLPEELQGPWTGLWMAKNAHLVHYPVSGGKAINVVAVISERWKAKEKGWACDADPDALLPHFQSWDKRLYDIVASAESWRKWTLFDLPPLRRWSMGAVTLLGDAAHPISPFMAQGGALAIEDAAILARTLAHYGGDVWAALPEYENARIERTARMRYESRRMGDVYHMSGLARRVRDFMLRRRSGEVLLKKFDWLYGFDALTPGAGAAGEA